MVSKRIGRLIEMANVLYYNVISEEDFNAWYYMFYNPVWMVEETVSDIYRKVVTMGAEEC